MAGRLTCEVCSGSFCARSDAVYCSSACRQKAHRARTARRQGARRPSTRVFVKPDVAGTISWSRLERRRARELCRAAEEIIRANAEAHDRLMSVVWLDRMRTPVSDQRVAGRGDGGTAARRLG